jgi:plasmid stabilization system protein ParE
VIVFVIEETSVRILRVLYGGRDLTTLNEGE